MQTQLEEARKFLKEETIAREEANVKEKNLQLTRTEADAEEGQLVWVVSPNKSRDILLNNSLSQQITYLGTSVLKCTRNQFW